MNHFNFQRGLLWAGVATILNFSSGIALAQDSIKIGEINSYKAQPAFLEPYRRGWEMALDEVNAAGGVLGKKLEVIARDDNGNPGDSVRVAEELMARERVALLFGGFLSNTGLALTDYAKQHKVFFLAAEPLTDKIVWQNGNKYTYRLRPSTTMLVAAVVKEAVKLKKKRWAIVYPNYEYGQSAVASFKAMMKQAQPDIEFVAEQAPRWARSMPAPSPRPWPMPSRRPSSMHSLPPTSASSCAKAIPAACSTTSRWCRY